MVEKNQRHQTMCEIKQQYQPNAENSLNVGIRIHAPNGHLTYVNEVFISKMVGYDAKEILHQPAHLLPYIPPERYGQCPFLDLQIPLIAEQIAQIRHRIVITLQNSNAKMVNT